MPTDELNGVTMNVCVPSDYEFQLLKQFYPFKNVRGWQLTMKAAETLCIVCLPPEKSIFPEKKYLGNRPSKKITFYKGLTIKFAFLRIF